MAKTMKRKVDREQLEQIRAELSLTQLEIAEELGVHVRTWAKWIAGERACPWSVWLALDGMRPKLKRTRKRKSKRG